MATDCHLLIPELFLPESTGTAPYHELALPALETLLTRGVQQRSSGLSLERWLAAAFRVAPQYDLPLAAASLRGEGVDPGDACWLQADPVHLEVRGDRLILADANCFAITAQEAADMLATLNAHFVEDGIEFIAPVPQRWYARGREDARIRTIPTSEVAGRSPEPHLPAGDDAARWRRLMSDAQMLLHPHACNETRDLRGELPVNSVWFWGAGRARGGGGNGGYGAVWSNHPLPLGLAAGAGLETRALPDSAASVIGACRDRPPDRPALVVLDELRPIACSDVAAWRGALATLETRWFAPILEALQRGDLPSVTLHGLGPDTSLASTYRRYDRLRFWRRRRRLADYVKPHGDTTSAHGVTRA